MASATTPISYLASILERHDLQRILDDAMSGAFKYKPKFVDIRIRPPKPGEEAAKADVFNLKPGQRQCEHPGCRRAAEARSPKSRDMPNEFYWFCPPHAAEYNKSWDFFAGMTEGEVRAFQQGASTGHRPTWSFKADANSREAAAFAAKMGTANQKPGWDPFGMFSRGRNAEVVTPEGRRLGKLERNALADLDLDESSKPDVIRARYHELIKRLHPDTNGGDRSMEDKLGRVIKAYKTLRGAKLA
jgi:hypothetical protein